MESEEVLNEAQHKMKQSLNFLEDKLTGIQTGRVSASFLDPVVVDINGSKKNVGHIASIGVFDAKTLKVQPWDKNDIKSVMKAIMHANLGVNPVEEGEGIIKVQVPTLSQERRQELVRIVHSYLEDAKKSIRNIRHNALEKIKAMEKSKIISEDEKKRLTDKIQKHVDEHSKLAEVIASKKEKSIIG